MDRRKVRSRGRRRKLRFSDVTCPICFSILIEPVTMPCRHEMCMPCFEKNGSTASLSCPMCRLRIGAWSRKAAREKKLINTDRWKDIQKHFPEEIAKRLAGEDEDLGRNSSCSVCISEPGEIRKEYEQKLKEFQQEEAILKEEQEKASLQLIKRLKDEEFKSDFVASDQTVDASLTQSMRNSSPEDLLNNTTNLSSSYSSTPSTVGAPSGAIKTRSTSVQSDDSISPELHHFKPIKAAPRTPPKQNRDGKLIEPSLVCIKPRKLQYNIESFQGDSSLYDVMQDRLYSVKRDRSLRTEPLLSTTSDVESTNNNCTSDICTYPVSNTFQMDDSDPEVTILNSSSFGYPLQSPKNTHLGKANKENQLSLNCKTKGKRAIECDHCTACSSNGFNFKRLRLTKVHRCTSNSKFCETSKKMCYRCKTSEPKPQSSVINSPHRQGKFATQEMCSTWRIHGHSEIPSSFTKCSSNKNISSASTMCFGHVNCERLSSTSSAASKFEDSLMDVAEKFYFQDVSIRTKQIEQDYVVACHLQDLFNEEANGARKASVKSDYNLRKKVSVSED